MPGWAELLAFAALGLAGAPHCAGMCGGFAIAVAAPGARRRACAGRLASYLLGKALCYAVLGVVCADAAALALRASERLGLGGARALLAWVVGAALVAAGAAAIVRRVGLAPRRAAPVAATGAPALAPARAALHALYASARRLPGGAGAFATGVATGLLPCGLSWSALLLASRLPAPAAALGMAAFGLATAPALAVTGAGARLVPRALRARAAPLAGALCILLGLATIARGGLPEGLAALERGLPECCRTDGGDGEARGFAPEVPPGGPRAVAPDVRAGP